MGRKKQLAFKYLKKINKVEAKSKPPQPHVKKYREIKKYEILHRPFDLKFRGRINKWLIKLEAESGLKFGKLLDRKQLKLIKLYYYPQGRYEKWLSQKEVVTKVPDVKIWKIRDELVGLLMLVWGSTKGAEIE